MIERRGASPVRLLLMRWSERHIKKTESLLPSTASRGPAPRKRSWATEYPRAASTGKIVLASAGRLMATPIPEDA
ncbi:hypothetical protein EAO75_43995 [Streptomyces sp. uw30]|nr:hypothetical protein EAO75_43995 [Streptomyces sp. uw30]